MNRKGIGKEAANVRGDPRRKKALGSQADLLARATDQGLRDFVGAALGEQGKVYDESEEKLGELWKQRAPAEPLPTTGPHADHERALAQALLILSERDDVAPLGQFVRSLPLPPGITHPLAGIIEVLHARARPLREGRPGGAHERWKDARYLAAFLAEKGIRAWKQEKHTTRIPEKERNAKVSEAIREINKWAIMRGATPLDPNVGSEAHNRVLELLRLSKKNRL